MRILLAALLLAVTSATWADWVKYGQHRGDVYYYDSTSIWAQGDLRRVSSILDLKERTTDGAMSVRYLMEIDCRGGRQRELSIYGHAGRMGTGKVTISRTTPWVWVDNPPEMFTPISTSNLQKIVCR